MAKGERETIPCKGGEEVSLLYALIGVAVLYLTFLVGRSYEADLFLQKLKADVERNKQRQLILKRIKDGPDAA